MNRIVRFVVMGVLILGVPLPMVFGSEDESSVSQAFKKIADLGPGVHAIQKDKKGRITACVVVGQARISTSLGKAKGLELARDKANLDCSAQFVKWLKEEATIYLSSDEESLILIEGKEGKEDDSLKESGKAVEKSGKKMESLSKGLVRGLQVIYKELDGEGKTYTIVKGWKADNAEATKRVLNELSSDEPKEKDKKDSNGSSSKTDSASPKKLDKEIKSGSTTSDDASEFLPKRNKK